MKRRKFIQNAGLATASFAAGAGAYHFFQPIAENIIDGEEWRNDRSVNQNDLLGLPSDEQVLEQAKNSIEDVRKVEVLLHLTDAADHQPIANQKVKVQQLDHQVDWGVAFGRKLVDLEDPIGRKYSEHLAQLFNCTTAKCYWNERWHQPIEMHKGVRIYELFEQEIAWAEAMNMRVKGHPLVWTVEKAIPKWVFKFPYEKQVEFLKSHVQELIKFSTGRISRWDLCNEMLWEPSFKNISTRHWPHIDPIEDIADYIAEAIRWAREINPNAIYSLNDYGLVLTYQEKISAHQQRERYLQLVEALRKRNATPDAIGCQAHIGGKFPLAAFQRMIDHLAESKLPIQITEFWSKDDDFPPNLSDTEREKEMAKYISDIYTVAFAHPAVSHFTCWGNGQFITEEAEIRKPYEALHNLINNQWKTSIELESNEEGMIAFKGFRGNYSIKSGSIENQIQIEQVTEKKITLS